VSSRSGSESPFLQAHWPDAAGGASSAHDAAAMAPPPAAAVRLGAGPMVDNPVFSSSPSGGAVAPGSPAERGTGAASAAVAGADALSPGFEDSALAAATASPAGSARTVSSFGGGRSDGDDASSATSSDDEDDGASSICSSAGSCAAGGGAGSGAAAAWRPQQGSAHAPRGLSTLEHLPPFQQLVPPPRDWSTTGRRPPVSASAHSGTAQRPRSGAGAAAAAETLAAASGGAGGSAAHDTSPLAAALARAAERVSPLTAAFDRAERRMQQLGKPAGADGGVESAVVAPVAAIPALGLQLAAAPQPGLQLEGVLGVRLPSVS